MIRLIVFALCLLVSCSKSRDKFDDVSPNDQRKIEYRIIAENIATNFVEGGFAIVSRKPDGSREHAGEGLIWGGTFIWAAPCDIAKPVSESMAAMVNKLDGQLIRVDPLGEYANGREATLDGVVGMLLGISRRIIDCGESSLWKEPMLKMITYQNLNGSRLHKNTQAKIVAGFKYVRDLIGFHAGSVEKPSDERREDLLKLAGGWPFAVKTAHLTGKGSDACFRVNLSLDAILTLELLGEQIDQKYRDQFCDNTDIMDIPTADHWCGRKSIDEYLASYVQNQWEYRHQRCSWESPDGKDNTSPQLDKLVAYVFANGWKQLQN